MLPESSSSLNPLITIHPHGIVAVDAQYVRPGHAAVHIIRQADRAAVVDTGTNHSVPQLLAALVQLGIAREAVEQVYLTHVHLDHAGGAGLLLQYLPNARAIVHPRGAPHMLDPTRLIAGSIEVYGQTVFRQLYGDIVPIAPERLVVASDGMRCELAGRRLQLMHTPGHALHHYVIVDQDHSGIFAGDTFGISLREFDTARGAFIMPITPPTQFDPQQLLDSVARLVRLAPESIYLMHYSRVTDIARLGGLLKMQIGEFVGMARKYGGAPDAEAAIRAAMFDLWRTLLREHGCTMPVEDMAELLEGDLTLNAQGLLVWLERQRKRGGA